jgi:hypothetical protein
VLFLLCLLLIGNRGEASFLRTVAIQGSAPTFRKLPPRTSRAEASFLRTVSIQGSASSGDILPDMSLEASFLRTVALQDKKKK